MHALAGRAEGRQQTLAVRVNTASARVASRVLLTPAMLSSSGCGPGEAGPGHRGRLDALHALELLLSEEPLLISDVQARVVAGLARIAPVTDELGRRFLEAGEEIAWSVGPSGTRCSAGRTTTSTTTSARPEVTERLVKGWADATWDIGRDSRHDRLHRREE